MPTYEYRCANGHDFEKFYRTISASEMEVACPTCGVMARRHLSAGAGLVFKGSGFYITDYGKDAKARRSGAKASGPESDGKVTPASETPPKPTSGRDAGPPTAADKGTSAADPVKHSPKSDD